MLSRLQIRKSGWHKILSIYRAQDLVSVSAEKWTWSTWHGQQVLQNLGSG